ncbi:MAG: N-acetylmuramoyl-L-alanine amidase [Intestinibacter sp.]|uniref:N-acetylmuramoyl-L-alanine amidase family protein n=1 Tax=Intestinibacter sp. TaxID=1965304 RepID=UPI0025C282FE|nr:N-acetylmuramoyl-L-alanine amidase [Intestinibacter sp.]MCI6736968.1 N-acetylmuramoyl-L-alanine amidase [Intestinibacter sp.]
MRKYKFLIVFILIAGIIIIAKSNQTKNLVNFVSNLNTVTIKQNEKYTICIDPGHQLKGDSDTEQMAPDSGSYKARVSSGTAGIATKKPEYELNLEASLKLKHILESRGYKVLMTRESHDVNISNMERAIFANENNADMVVRIHADGSNDSGVTGACILIPSKDGQYTSGIFSDSSECAKYVNENMKNNGFKVNGIFERSDLTGFNWSKVPVVLVEMGFMSNYTEDQNMASPQYQEKMMKCIADGLDQYFKNKK